MEGFDPGKMGPEPDPHRVLLYDAGGMLQDPVGKNGNGITGKCVSG